MKNDKLKLDHPMPLHPAPPSTLYPPPSTLHPTPYASTLHLELYTLSNLAHGDTCDPVPPASAAKHCIRG